MRMMRESGWESGEGSNRGIDGAVGGGGGTGKRSDVLVGVWETDEANSAGEENDRCFLSRLSLALSLTIQSSLSSSSSSSSSESRRMKIARRRLCLKKNGFDHVLERARSGVDVLPDGEEGVEDEEATFERELEREAEASSCLERKLREFIE